MPAIELRLEDTERLDPIDKPLRRWVDRLLPRGKLKDTLHGVWLGHPAHPPLTDLSIGFWTSAFVLDLVGGRRSRRAADTLIGLGVVTAVPTAAVGVADWSELDQPARRVGIVHAMANLAATGLYGASYVARRRGNRLSGVALAFGGATAATAGGFLGGHLTYRRAAGVNQAAAAPAPSDWTTISIDGELSDSQPAAGSLDDATLAVVGRGAPTALFDRCSHLGGPMHEGDVVDGCLRCPWHGSTFDLVDGSVVAGPAVAPQPCYSIRVDGEAVHARRR